MLPLRLYYTYAPPKDATGGIRRKRLVPQSGGAHSHTVETTLRKVQDTLIQVEPTLIPRVESTLIQAARKPNISISVQEVNKAQTELFYSQMDCAGCLMQACLMIVFT